MDLSSEQIVLLVLLHPTQKAPPDEPKPFTVIFDPSSCRETNDATSIMRACGFDLGVGPEESKVSCLFG